MEKFEVGTATTTDVAISDTFAVSWQNSEQTAQLPVLRNPVTRAREYLLSLQVGEGYWEALFEMDVRQTGEYIFLKHILGTVDAEEEKRMVRFIMRMEKAGGGWSNFYGGPPDLSTTVTAYYALRLCGVAADHPMLQRAKDVIMHQGGIMKANCFTRSYLQLFGQMDAASLPAMPIEIVLLPQWFPLNIYSISSWSRTIVIPLLLIAALRDKHAPAPGPSCEELYPDNCDRRAMPIARSKHFFSWHNFFLAANWIMKFYERHPLSWLRKLAIGKAHLWLTQRMGRPGGLCAIFPPMVNACIALRYMGYDLNHPLVANELRAIAELKVEDKGATWVQPCFSTLWDTAWCLKILPELGVSPSHPAMVRAKEYLLSVQVGEVGDWQTKIPPVPCGGWYFERENGLYPDNDDTAAVLMALQPYRHEPKVKESAERAIQWMFAMQCRDGGWASFDYQNHVYECLNYIPFADHGALLDPPTADVTARVLESLAGWGYNLSHKNVQRAVAWLLKDQKPDGSWFGRWGVNYIYGTWATLCGLQAIGFNMQKPQIRKAVRWLLDHQRPDGGWGESCASYPNPSQKGLGESTASQTAWALMALDAAGESNHPAVRKGVKYLTDSQQADGSWKEEYFTGTGFPGVCYLRYHLYRNHFPALALARILPKIS